MLAVLLAASLSLAARTDKGGEVDRGQRLFRGDAAMAARIVGQDFALPPHASRCINCHRSSPTAASSQAFGPPLTASALLEPTRRRGGPPSRYDAGSLCALLRTGIDPAQVMIQRAMPRYELSDSDCRALWRYLTQAEAPR